ncbi:MAG: hypothetical protein KBE05_09690 [Sulfurospirillum sp.]|nr:hypothetical protein [Sulfurospirillum sp.]
MEKIIDLLTRISELYAIPQWAVNTGAIAIFCILVAFPFVVRHLMQPKYYRFRELILFKVLWRWKYKKGDVVGLWCYCPKCQAMLMVDDENCRSNESLQDKVTYFICNECGGHELGRVVGGDRRYALSLVKRDLWRHIKEGTFNEVSTATKEALTIYQEIEASKKSESDVSTPVEPSMVSTQEVMVIDKEKATECELEEALHVKSEEVHNELNEEVKKDGI